MDNLSNALRSSIENKNWYGALFIALSVPDICGYIESPNSRSQARYEEWFKKYMLHKYSMQVGANATQHTFLSPSDCYALRCALLHEGREEIVEQRARDALDRFHFIEPPPGGMIHCNQVNNILQLQVDIFCSDILGGLAQWQKDMAGNAEAQERVSYILKVYPTGNMP